jgi:hypothetical protein
MSGERGVSVYAISAYHRFMDHILLPGSKEEAMSLRSWIACRTFDVGTIVPLF